MAGTMRRVLAPLVLIGFVAGACSGGDEGDGDGAAGGGPSGQQVDEAGGAGVDGEIAEEDAVAAAEAFVDGYDELGEEARGSLELVGTRRSPGVAHVRFRQVFDGVPVRAAQLVVHVGDDGEVLGASDGTTDALPEPGVEQQLDQAAATDVANKAVPSEVLATTAANEVWLQDGDGLRLGWSVQMAVPGSSYTVWVDAVSGEVADSRETRLEHDAHHHDDHHGDERAAAAAPVQVAGECDLEALDAEGPVACIFSPDPVVGAGGDVPDPDDADQFRVAVELLGLDDPDSGALVGEFVTVESPDDPEEPIREPDGVWDQGATEPGFESVMSYFWIDHAQRLIQDLGFTDVRNGPMAIVPRDEAEVDNAFFTPALDTIFMGVGSGGRQDAAEDARVVLHEYGHAVLHAQVPDMLFNDAGGAYHDGFADAFAGLVAMELSDDPACLFPWFLGEFDATGCGRRFDNDKVFPVDVVNQVHADGEIWSGAVFAILEGLLEEEGLVPADCAGTTDCDEVRDRVLATIIGANEFMTGTEDLPEIAQAYLLANEAAFGDEDRELVEQVLAERGLDGGGDGVTDDGGVPTGDGTGVELAVDISHTFRGDLRLTAVVVDADFEERCTPITLLEPDPSDSTGDVSGTIDVTDTDCGALGAPSADVQWVLLAEDTLAQDTGQINGFGVVVDGQPFLATGVPAPIADADPTGTAVIVNGSGSRVPQEGEQAPGDTAAGVPFASIEIAHTFVGDLQVRVGVARGADGSIVCSIPVLEPSPREAGEGGVAGDVDLSPCTDALGAPGTVVFLEVVDTAALDEGTIERFEVFAPDGTSAGAAEVPVAIPDDDPAGGVALVAV